MNTPLIASDNQRWILIATSAGKRTQPNCDYRETFQWQSFINISPCKCQCLTWKWLVNHLTRDQRIIHCIFRWYQYFRFSNTSITLVLTDVYVNIAMQGIENALTEVETKIDSKTFEVFIVTTTTTSVYIMLTLILKITRCYIIKGKDRIYKLHELLQPITRHLTMTWISINENAI